MKKIALVTGITGQDGSYLAELLLQKNYEVHGIKRRSSSFNTGRVNHILLDRHTHERDGVILHFGDLTDTPSLIRIIQDVKPDEIYNLAAQSHVQVSFETPEYTANADAIGVLRILEAIRFLKLERKIKFYQASTSEMFGLSDEKILNENSSFYPRSPYGVSKLYAHFITINYREAYNMFNSSGILFNHESPRRGETFVTQKIVRAAIQIQKLDSSKLYLGNLDAIRDWGHAKDYVDGIWRMLQHSVPEDFVLATGITYSVRDFAKKVFDFVGMPITFHGHGVEEIATNQAGDTVIEVDSAYFRPTEVPHLQGDYSKAKELLDWEPTISIDYLIEDMVMAEVSRVNPNYPKEI